MLYNYLNPLGMDSLNFDVISRGLQKSHTWWPLTAMFEYYSGSLLKICKRRKFQGLEGPLSELKAGLLPQASAPIPAVEIHNADYRNLAFLLANFYHRTSRFTYILHSGASSLISDSLPPFIRNFGQFIFHYYHPRERPQ